MLHEEKTTSSERYSVSGKHIEEHSQPGSVTKNLLQSAWQKHRILTSLGVVVALVLLTIVIQNPAKTTVDLLLWTVSIRQGVGLAITFVIGGICGWVTRSLFRKERPGE
jgi:uncharacterized integral membrane protein